MFIHLFVIIYLNEKFSQLCDLWSLRQDGISEVNDKTLDLPFGYLKRKGKKNKTKKKQKKTVGRLICFLFVKVFNMNVIIIRRTIFTGAIRALQECD